MACEVSKQKFVIFIKRYCKATVSCFKPLLGLLAERYRQYWTTMKGQFFIIILLTNFVFLFGQNSCVTGIVADGKNPISFALVILVADSSKKNYQATTDMNGVYIFKQIPKNSYQLSVSYLDYRNQTLNGLKVDTQDTLKVNVQLEICSWNYELKTCPICNKNDLVIRVNYNQLQLHYSFKTKKNEKAYYEKIKKQGYITVTDNETSTDKGQEVLWRISDEKEHNRLTGTNICDKFLFCKRDKKVFQ